MHWIGSPLPVRRLTRLESNTEEAPSGVRGWAWYPGDPDRDPSVLIHSAAGTQLLGLVDAEEQAQRARPLARPWRFSLPHVPATKAVTDEAGRHLCGSPLPLGLEQRITSAMLQGQSTPAPGPVFADWAGRLEKNGTEQDSRVRVEIAVLVPVYRGVGFTVLCLGAVRRTVPPATRIVVVEDA